jgi:hypothetical protein
MGSVRLGGLEEKNPGVFQLPVRVYFSTKETKPRESNANVN